MHLYEVEVWNGDEAVMYERLEIIVVSKNKKIAKKQAIQKAKKMSNGDCEHSEVTSIKEIFEIDGYKISIGDAV